MPAVLADCSMKSHDNMGGGTSLFLLAGDSLDAVPDSHKDIVTPEIRRAFDDPIAYFRTAADQCRFSKMAEWLRAVTQSGRWQLVLAEGWMMDRCTQGGFFLWSPSVRSAVIAPPAHSDFHHFIDEFAHYYSLVDSIQWEDFACAGGLLGNGQPSLVRDYGIESRTTAFPPDRSYVWGSSGCGDVIAYTTDDRLGLISHETGKAYFLGSIQEGIDWVFSELLNGRTPEFDYGKAV